MKSKKGLEQEVLIKLTIGISTAIIFLVFILDPFSNQGEIDAANIECKLLFYTAITTDTFYNQANDGFTNNFYKQIQERCPSFIIKDTTPKKAGTLADSCWKAIGSGDEFLPNGMVQQSFCYYCGTINFKRDYSSSDFFKEFNGSVSQTFYQGETEILSEEILKDFSPKKDKNYGMFVFYERRESNSSLQDYFATKFSSIGFRSSLLANHFLFSDKKTFSTLTFTEIQTIQNNETKESEETFIVDGNKKFQEKYNCKLPSPKNVFEI